MKGICDIFAKTMISIFTLWRLYTDCSMRETKVRSLFPIVQRTVKRDEAKKKGKKNH